VPRQPHAPQFHRSNQAVLSLTVLNPIDFRIAQERAYQSTHYQNIANDSPKRIDRIDSFSYIPLSLPNEPVGKVIFLKYSFPIVYQYLITVAWYQILQLKIPY
jgi:hypothetical protein